MFQFCLKKMIVIFLLISLIFCNNHNSIKIIVLTKKVKMCLKNKQIKLPD